MSEIKKPKRRSPSPRVQAKSVFSSTRDRVLYATFSLFREQGFSSTSMLDIVTRARDHGGGITVSQPDRRNNVTNGTSKLPADVGFCQLVWSPFQYG